MNQRQHEIWRIQRYGDASIEDISSLSAPKKQAPKIEHTMGISSSEQVLSAIGTDFD